MPEKLVKSETLMALHIDKEYSSLEAKCVNMDQALSGHYRRATLFLFAAIVKLILFLEVVGLMLHVFVCTRRCA